MERIKKIVGSFRDQGEVNNRMEFARRHFHLVSPATAVGRLPEGCGIAFSVVYVDPRPMELGGEVYSTGGFGAKEKFGLARSALDRISAAAGISWDPQLSCRLDDGSDPRYCLYRAVGHVTHFDGTRNTITRHKEMDLRKGSPQIESLTARLRPSTDPTAPKPTIDKQLRELRLHILAHAESKAMNRVIRALGLPSGFVKKDLEKPFVVAKLMWTGESDDPALRLRFAEMTAAHMLGGRQALYGAASVPGVAPAALPQTLHGGHLVKPPPVGETFDNDDDDDEAPPVQTTGTSVPGSDPGAGAGGPPVQRPAGHVVLVRFGRDKGKPITHVNDLDWYAKALAESVNDPEKARFRAENEADLKAIESEMRRRNGEVDPEDEPPPVDGEKY